MTLSLEHDPEKWKPVFRKDHAQTKRYDHDAIFSNRIMIKGTLTLRFRPGYHRRNRRAKHERLSLWFRRDFAGFPAVFVALRLLFPSPQ